MKKRDALENWVELREARDQVANEGLQSLASLLTASESDVPTSAQIAADIVSLTRWDAENDQSEIANLIAVANSEMFDRDLRDRAARRVVLMLELR